MHSGGRFCNKDLEEVDMVYVLCGDVTGLSRQILVQSLGKLDIS